MKKFIAFLVMLNNRIISRLGVALFVPALTALLNPALAATFLGQFLPHLPAVDVQILGGSVAGVAGFLLYQGKPEAFKPVPVPAVGP